MKRPLSFRLAALAALGLLWGAAGVSDGAGQKSDAEVKVTAKGDKPGADGKQTVTVTLTINKGWHVYANPVGQDDLKGAQTYVTATGKEKPEEVVVQYPPGKVIKDKDVGDYKVYEDKVEIKVTVKRAKGDTSPLEVTAKFQACNDKTCLLPATVKVQVD